MDVVEMNARSSIRVAVASDDGNLISPHFGRSRYFIVFTVRDGEVVQKEIRSNLHAEQHHGHHGEGHDHRHHAHDHSDFLTTLDGCQAVICGGMGRRALAFLAQQGIEPMIIDAGMTPESAVVRFAKGELETTGGPCHCSH